MCGVAAGVGAAASDTPRILAGVAHRGPDASGTATLDGVAVGGARLRVVGGPACDQPFHDGSIVAAWNGEAFNLARDSAEGDDGGDLRPTVAAFKARGAAAFSEVRGPFAAAFADAAAKSLTLARDPLGVRPLYVHVGSDGVRAASEPWPLIEGLGPSATFDPEALAHLFAYQFPPVDRGLVRGVDPVLPGAVRTFEADDRGGARERAATRCDYLGAGEDDLARALRAAAKLQGPCARRTGIFLSGGLDSSAVLGLAAEAGAAPDAAFVGWFPEGEASLDERPFARAAAAACGVRLIETPIDARSAFAAVAPAMRALGGPCGGPGVLSAFVLAEAARREDVAVVFTGQGGDELFGGYERHRVLSAILRGDARRGDPSYEPLEGAMRAAADPLRAAIVRGDALAPLLEPEVAAAVARVVAETLPPLGDDRVDRALAFELRTFLPGLFAVDDRALGAFGLEGRVPLADPVVARLASAVGYDEKCPPEAPRRLLRSAVGKALPPSAAARRDKMGFPMPLAAWFRGPWKSPTMDLLSGDALVALGFRRGAARAAFEAGRLSPRDVWFLLATAIFENETASARCARRAPSSANAPAAPIAVEGGR